MRTLDNTEAIILTPDVVATRLERVISDLRGFVMPALEKTPETLHEAAVCDMAIGELKALASVLKKGA